MDPTTRTLMMGSSAGGDSYWINTISYNSGNGLQSRVLTLDSLNNVYGTGATTAGPIGSADGYIYKLDKDGLLQWQRFVGNSVNSDYAIGVAANSTNDLFVAGYGYNNNLSNNSIFLHKYDSNTGNLTLQTSLGNAGSTGQYVPTLAIDSSSNLYVCCYDYTRTGGTRAEAILAKYNSAFGLQWAKYVDAGFTGVVAQSADSDTSGSRVGIGGYGWYPGISKWGYFYSNFDNNGTNLFTYWYGDQVNGAFGMDSFSDNSNIYMCGYATNGTYNTARVLKISAAGNILWQRTIDANNNNNEAYGYGITADSAGNVYVLGDYYVGPSNSTNYVFLCKYDSNGNLLWARSFVPSSTGYATGTKIVTDSRNNVYVQFYYALSSTPGVHRLVTAKIPPDGSRTGTYGAIIYGTPSLSFGNSNFSTINIGYSIGNPSLGSVGFSVSSVSGGASSSTINL